MQATIEIPDGPLTEEVSSWKDGQRYTFTVVQDSTGAFTAEKAEPAEEETPAEEAAPGEESESTANPAVLAVIAKGKTGMMAGKKMVA